MQTKKSPAKGEARRDEWDPLDADSVSELKRQYDAMEESLRHYVDQRLAIVDVEANAGQRWPPRRAAAGEHAVH